MSTMNKASLQAAKEGFKTLRVNEKYQHQALKNLEQWLSDKQYAEYVRQIEHLIANSQWDYLLDSFYQVIPFGTGGRRGEVGVGPNRINPLTVKNSAQGHAQYLLSQYGEAAKTRGVVLAYDVREFTGNAYLSTALSNPVQNLTSKDLAFSAAEVYAGNGIKVFVFEGIRTTPELSFAIRHLQAAGGDVFSASHNPPAYNGKKVYDEFGGQLIPPHDEALVSEVTENVTEIKQLAFDEARAEGIIEFIGASVDDAYVKSVSKISLSDDRNIKIVYTPLHGAGSSSVVKVLTDLGFNVLEDPKTSNQSGRFENVTFNIPNPEVVQSFETSLGYAAEVDADILLSSDPDADRIGIMVKHDGDWVFVTGNEIGTMLTDYAARRLKTPGRGVVIKTVVTTDAIARICEKNGLEIVGDLLIGFKYVGDIMNKLEADGRIDDFMLGIEESHGYLAGNYARDKDAAAAAVWLAELAAELKRDNKTLVDYLREIYIENGYFKNYLTEIRMLGATGQENIQRIQAAFRKNPPEHFGNLQVEQFVDYLTHEPIVSETDRTAKDVLVFHLSGAEEVDSCKVTVRPSGTEPKIKVYFELGFHEVASEDALDELMQKSEQLVHVIEKEVLSAMYSAIGIDFPERGFLLFWQLPLDDKMRYFEVEPELAKLRDIPEKETRQEKADELLAFLGSNPLQKIDDAFKAEFGSTVTEYLRL